MRQQQITTLKSVISLHAYPSTSCAKLLPTEQLWPQGAAKACGLRIVCIHGEKQEKRREGKDNHRVRQEPQLSLFPSLSLPPPPLNSRKRGRTGSSSFSSLLQTASPSEGETAAASASGSRMQQRWGKKKKKKGTRSVSGLLKQLFLSLRKG